MIRDKERTAVLIVIFLAIGVLGYFMALIMVRIKAIQVDISTGGVSPVDVSGWETYRNGEYGFELQYPSSWKFSADGLAAIPPVVAFGNPLTGTSTYVMQVFMDKNPKMLSSGSYAHDLLAIARAEDAANAEIAPTPQIAPQFDKVYVLTVGGYSAFELYNVFEFDHGAERIYVAHGDEVLRFDFPVQKENPNIALPVANGQIAHEIMNTLVFTK